MDLCYTDPAQYRSCTTSDNGRLGSRWSDMSHVWHPSALERLGFRSHRAPLPLPHSFGEGDFQAPSNGANDQAPGHVQGVILFLDAFFSCSVAQSLPLKHVARIPPSRKLLVPHNTQPLNKTPSLWDALPSRLYQTRGGAHTTKRVTLEGTKVIQMVP